ncbi:MAG: hypothetical protein HN580_04975 [Deltaproteobacteria bacterium]|nr:hypothetical protein [Deltaproteobacteria bacterium]
MNYGGFAGKVLLVDLTSKEITQEPLDMQLAVKFIGGLGLTLKLAYDNITPGAGALEPENIIAIGAGPLVGTGFPSTSRVFAVSKLPSSDTIGWCGAGGADFGCQLKNTGFDHIIIKGKADKPVFLKIIDDQAEICDADDLWGRGVEETSLDLWNRVARPAGVISIGQGGENLSTFSMAFIDRISTLGRGGLGAVFGSKNLKAILVKGSQGIQVADRKEYKRLHKELTREIRDYPYLKEWQDQGMLKSFPIVPMETYDKIKKRHVACVSCPFGCKDIVEIKDGEYKGQVICSSSAINLFTPQIYGIKDYRESIKLVSILDSFGLDFFEFFAVITFAMKLVEKGVIRKELADPEIKLDSFESMKIWATKTALRQGLGDVLAGGFKGMIQEFGEESTQYAPAMIKGIHPYAGPGSALPWSLFGTMELGQVLDPRGPHVGSGGSPTYFAKRPLDVFYKHFQRMGIPGEAVERILTAEESDESEKSLKVGTLLKYSHSWFSTLGSIGICARAQVNRFYSAELCADIYQAVTGIETSLDQLRERVDRVWTLYRLMNLRENLPRETDQPLPERWFKADGFKEYVSEKPLSPEDVRQMIEDYYAEWGWDRITGEPSPAILEKLGLV